MKREIRLLGIDDAPFDKFDKRPATVIGAMFRGGSFMDGCLSTKVEIDGTDSTARLIQMVNACKWKSQLKALLLDGIAVAGFNIIDISRLSKRTGTPVIVVIRRMPDVENIKTVLIKLGMKSKVRLLDRAGPVMKHGNIFFQCIGIEREKAAEILRISSTRSDIPEPIRVAHLIGQGLMFGESKGRA